METTEIKLTVPPGGSSGRFLQRNGKINRMVKASIRGDTRRVTNLLKEDPQLVNERDEQGRYPLAIAVKGNRLEVVEELLPHCASSLLHDALMLSISLGHDHISEVILQHDNYESGQTSKPDTLSRRRKSTDEFVHDDSLFAADVSPLILAAQRNQYEIVTLLKARREHIPEPHTFTCECKVCGSTNRDELRSAKTRLNIYKALASPAYVSIFYEDPIMRAFELGNKLRKLAFVEKYFSSQYLQLAEQLSDYVTRLLDRVRDGQELQAVLDQGRSLTSRGRLARLKLAVRYQEKKFVAHPSCQKKLTTVWFGKLVFLSRINSWTYFLFMLGMIIAYPFMALCFWIYPWGRLAEVLRTPVIKFIAGALSYFFFLGIIVVYTFTESPSTGDKISEDPKIGMAYQSYINMTTSPIITDVYVRYHSISYGSVILTLFIVGLILQSCKKLYSDGYTNFKRNRYNLMDVTMLALFVASFVLRFYSRVMVKKALDHFHHEDSWIRAENSTSSHLYWLSADRHDWRVWDPALVGDALFAIANVISLCRCTYVLAVSERMGPLLISLTRIARDVAYFMIIFIVIIIAFIVGFRNLYWYYDISNRKKAELVLPVDDDHDENVFGSFGGIISLVYWSIYGMVEFTDVDIPGYESTIINIVGHVLFAIYNWIIVIILINMLIAMMARSYETIAEDEDIEWKYYRSELYLEYIKSGSTLCVPFNLLPNYKPLLKCCCPEWYKQQQLKDGSLGQGEPDQDDSIDLSEIEQRSDVTSVVGDKSVTDSGCIKYAFYLDTIQRMVKRFIAQANKPQSTSKLSSPTEIAEFQMSALQKDISNFRYEIMSALRRQEYSDEDTQRKLNGVEDSLLQSRDDVLSALHSHFTGQHDQIQRLQNGVDSARESLVTLSGKADELTAEARKELSQLLATVGTLNDSVSGLDKELTCVHTQMETVDESLVHMKEALSDLGTRVSDLASWGSQPRGRSLPRLHNDPTSPHNSLHRDHETIARNVTSSTSVGAALSYTSSPSGSIRKGSESDLRPTSVSARKVHLN